MHLRLFFVFILSSFLNLNSQILYVSSSMGFSRSKEFLKLNDYTVLVGDKKLQNYELLNYTKTSLYRLNFNLKLGVDLFKKNEKLKKFHPIYEVAYSFIPATLKAEFRNDEVITGSLFPSSQTALSYQYGFMIRDEAHAILNYYQMFLENGISFKLRAGKQISLDYGAQFLLGNTKMKGSYVFHEMDSIEYKKFDIGGTSYYENKIIGSYYENPDYYPIEVSNVSFGFSFPVGIDFRLGENPQKFGRFHLLFYVKPTFVLSRLKDIQKFKYSYISNFSLVSFKIDMKTKKTNEN